MECLSTASSKLFELEFKQEDKIVSEAIVKIQKVFRGYLTRKNIVSNTLKRQQLKVYKKQTLLSIIKKHPIKVVTSLFVSYLALFSRFSLFSSATKPTMQPVINQTSFALQELCHSIVSGCNQNPSNTFYIKPSHMEGSPNYFEQLKEEQPLKQGLSICDRKKCSCDQPTKKKETSVLLEISSSLDLSHLNINGLYTIYTKKDHEIPLSYKEESLSQILLKSFPKELSLPIPSFKKDLKQLSVLDLELGDGFSSHKDIEALASFLKKEAAHIKKIVIPHSRNIEWLNFLLKDLTHVEQVDLLALEHKIDFDIFDPLVREKIYLCEKNKLHPSLSKILPDTFQQLENTERFYINVLKRDSTLNNIKRLFYILQQAKNIRLIDIYDNTWISFKVAKCIAEYIKNSPQLKIFYWQDNFATDSGEKIINRALSNHPKRLRPLRRACRFFSKNIRVYREQRFLGK